MLHGIDFEIQMEIRYANKNTDTNQDKNINTSPNTDRQGAKLLACPCNMVSNLHFWPQPLLKHLSLLFIGNILIYGGNNGEKLSPAIYPVFSHILC